MKGAGRPRSFEAGAALDAALELFWKNGYRITTTRELENGLGLKASSIYNAFGSKEALLLKAMARYEQRVTQELVQPLEASDEGLPAIDRFFQALGHWVTHDGRRGCMLVNLMAEEGDTHSPVAKRVRSYRDRLAEALRGALKRASSVGECPPSEVESRSALLLCVIFGINIAARGGASTAELERQIKGIREQVSHWRAS